MLVTYRELGERCKLESRLSRTTKAGRGYGPFLRRHISQARWRFLNLCALREATAWSRESTSADDILVLSRENEVTVYCNRWNSGKDASDMTWFNGYGVRASQVKYTYISEYIQSPPTTGLLGTRYFLYVTSLPVIPTSGDSPQTGTSGPCASFTPLP